eukprot:2747098-Amphidinium_carterae.1
MAWVALALCLAYMGSVNGYAVLTKYASADCTGEPMMVQASVPEVTAISYFGSNYDDCLQLREVRRISGKDMKAFRVKTEEDGTKCTADFFADETCLVGPHTLEIWNGICKSKGTKR